MNDEFDGTYLVAGSFIANRAFKVDEIGRLRSPYRDDIILPGVNEGKCPHMHVLHRNQPVACKGCSCGYYAYYDPGARNAFLYGNNAVDSIIESTGRITHGTKGIRAQNMKVVAAVAPGPPSKATSKFYKACHNINHTFGAGCAAIMTLAFFSCTLFGLIFAEKASVLNFILLLVSLSMLISGCMGMAGEMLKSRVDETVSARMQKLRAAYPDVKFYNSRREMLKNHPLSAPPQYPEDKVSTPEDKDFWTVNADV